MTSVIFKHVVATVVLVFASVINLYAQQAQQPSADEMLNQIGMLKRLEAMQPDSVGPKYQLALASLNYAVTYPHAAQTEPVLAQAGDKLPVSKLDPAGRAAQLQAKFVEGMKQATAQ